jgi:hypothetical protein
MPAHVLLGSNKFLSAAVERNHVFLLSKGETSSLPRRMFGLQLLFHQINSTSISKSCLLLLALNSERQSLLNCVLAH